MAQGGVAAAAEHRRHPAAPDRLAGIPDRIDATKDGVKPTQGQPIANRPIAEAEFEQLPTSDDPMLARSEGSDRPLDLTSLTFGLYLRSNRTHVWIAEANR